MAQPPAYNREKNFTLNSGRETDHAALNAELDRASNSINDIRTNLAILQADDGKIRASSITTDSLSQDVLDYVQDSALAGANAVADAATAIAEEAKTIAGEAVETATGAADTSGLAEAKAQQAINASNSAVEKADQALSEANQIDSKVGDAVTKALEGVEIPGLNAETISAALGYTPYDAVRNEKNFATDEEVAQAIAGIPAQVNADWSATEGAAEIRNKPTTLDGYGITDAVHQSELIPEQNTSADISGLTIEPNTVYQLGTISSLTITSVNNGYRESQIRFSVAADIPTIVIPDTLKHVGEWEMEVGSDYIISIVDNIAVMGKVVS